MNLQIELLIYDLCEKMKVALSILPLTIIQLSMKNTQFNANGGLYLRKMCDDKSSCTKLYFFLSIKTVIQIMFGFWK